MQTCWSCDAERDTVLEAYKALIADAYTTDDIIYEWDDVSITTTESVGNVLPSFLVVGYHNSTCSSNTTTGAKTTQLLVTYSIAYFLRQLHMFTRQYLLATRSVLFHIERLRANVYVSHGTMHCKCVTVTMRV